MAAEDAGEPGFCAVPGCGVRDRRHLCRRCRLAHTSNGELAGWVRELQNMARREADRERYHRRKGVTVESLEQYLADCPQ